MCDSTCSTVSDPLSSYRRVCEPHLSGVFLLLLGLVFSSMFEFLKFQVYEAEETKKPSTKQTTHTESYQSSLALLWSSYGLIMQNLHQCSTSICSIFCSLSISATIWQPVHRDSSGIPLPSHVLQFLLGNPEALSGPDELSNFQCAIYSHVFNHVFHHLIIAALHPHHFCHYIIIVHRRPPVLWLLYTQMFIVAI